MRQSDLFTKTRREAPKDEVAKNAILLTRAGFIHKEMAGVYSMLPLGLRVLNKISDIIREEMDKIGAFEVHLTTLQDPKIWEKSGRWSDDVVDIWFKTELAGGTEIGIANTHEEPLANLMRQHIASYKDLPRYAYQIHTKFRNELRAKSGIMRGREFLMKDLYSFVSSEKELEEFHEKCAEAYMRVFERCGIGERTFRTFADGEPFSKFSDEFQTISEAGEDIIYLDKNKELAVNKEVYTDDVLKELDLKKDELEEVKAIEVGNIFKLGTKFSEAEGLEYLDENGKSHPVIMGSYGIGVSRLMGAVVEVLADDAGIVWPEEIAPFRVHLLALPGGEEEADKLYEKLLAQNIEVLYDNRQDISAGQKFSEADLLGIPLRAVVSERSLEKGGIEVKRRDSDKQEIMNINKFIEHVK